MPDVKIFIDTDEEITFILEKIRNAATKNVALIVPDRASVFITSASLKLLKKSIDRLDKKVIIVTMDAAGTKMAYDIGFKTVERVRDINPDVWEQVSKSKPIKKNHYNQTNVTREEYPLSSIKEEKSQKELQKEPILELQAKSQAGQQETQEEAQEKLLSEQEEVLNISERKFQYKHAQVSQERSDNISQNILLQKSLQSEELPDSLEDNKLNNETDLEESLDNNQVSNQKWTQLENASNYSVKEEYLHDDSEQIEEQEFINSSHNLSQHNVQDSTDNILDSSSEFKMPEFHGDKNIEESNIKLIKGQPDFYKPKTVNVKKDAMKQDELVFVIGKDIQDEPQINVEKKFNSKSSKKLNILNFKSKYKPSKNKQELNEINTEINQENEENEKLEDLHNSYNLVNFNTESNSSQKAKINIKKHIDTVKRFWIESASPRIKSISSITYKNAIILKDKLSKFKRTSRSINTHQNMQRTSRLSTRNTIDRGSIDRQKKK